MFRHSQTRPLTPEEQQYLDGLWETYLTTTAELERTLPNNVLELANTAWREYQTGLRSKGIIPTLAGYRAVRER